MSRSRNDLAHAAAALLRGGRIAALRSDEMAVVKHIACKRTVPDAYHWRQLARLKRKVRSAASGLVLAPGGGAA